MSAMATATKVPDAFFCPITHEIMQDPVVDRDGVSYERYAITQWLGIHHTSPVTRNKCTIDQLRPNLSLKELIQNGMTQVGQVMANELFDEEAGATTATTPTTNITVRIVPHRELMAGEDISEQELIEQSTPLGGRLSYEGYNCFQSLYAEILQDGTKVGSMSMELLQRPDREFNEACDAEDADLYDVGSTFFNMSGKCKVQSVIDAEQQEEYQQLPFLHISSLKLIVKDPDNSYIAAAALRHLLFKTALREEWGICIYVPDSYEARTTFDQEHSIQFNTTTMKLDMNAETEAARTKVIHEAQENDARPFVRCGFRQVIDKSVICTATCEYLFATPTFLKGNNMMSHVQACGVPYVRKHVRVPLSGKNKEMFDQVQIMLSKQENMRMSAATIAQAHVGLMTSPASSTSSASSTTPTVQPPHSFPEQIQALSALIDLHVSNGAKLYKTPLLHLCAALQMPAFATLILNKGADVDLLDEEGYTALMVAAGSAYGKSSLHTAAPYACIEIIVNAGATLTVKAPAGVTALGMYWRGKQESDNFRQMLRTLPPAEQVAAQTAVDERVVALLSVENVVPNNDDQMYAPKTTRQNGTEDVEEEARAKSVLEMIYAQQGAAPGSVTSLLAAEGATAMELLTTIVPEAQMRNQLLMIHASLGSVMQGHDFEDEEDY